MHPALIPVARRSLADDLVVSVRQLSQANIVFHREIAAASGNAVLLQLLQALEGFNHEEQRTIQDVPWRERFHREHGEILEALVLQEADLATERMRVHLESVRAAILQSDPQRTTHR